jgi:colanic acid biosynthesis glycosyl transferase WcaI
MKILIYSYNYHPEPIGIAPLMTELAEGLAKRGHEVRVLTGMPNYPERQIYEGYRNKFYCTETINGVRIDRCYVWIRPKPGLVTRLALDGSFAFTSFARALMNGWRPDVMLMTSPPLAASVPAAVLRWIYRCPLVLSLQDILPEAAVHTGLITNKRAIQVFEALERFAYRKATAIGAIAEGFVDNLRSKGVPADKIHLIPNWVDVNFIRPLPKHNSFHERHNLQGKFVVLYSGNIALTQGLETVIDAAKLLDDHPEADAIQFVIVGEARAIKKLASYCRENTVSNRVMLLPFQPRAVLPEMLAAADVSLIVQRRNVVGFNMPSKTQLILASGRPAIASVPAHGTAAQAIRRSQAGLVVEPESPRALADAVLCLAKDPDRANRLGQRGRQHAVEFYSFEASLDRYEQLFYQLTKRSTPADPGAIATDGPPASLSPSASHANAHESQTHPSQAHESKAHESKAHESQTLI